MSEVHIESARAAAKGETSTLGRAWDRMDEREREFWLRGVGEPAFSRDRKWVGLGAAAREKIKVILPKVARRAALIVEGAE